MKGRCSFTKEMVEMKVAHVWCTKGYTRGKSLSPRHPVVVKGTSEGYGGSDGDDGSGRNKGHAQNGEIKSARERCKERANQRLTTFGPITSLFFFLARAR